MQHKFLFLKESKIFSSKYVLMHFASLCVTFLAAATAYAQKPFITTWKTDNPGLSNNKSIIIPTTGAGFKYDVDWNNDGIFDQTGITGGAAHDFGVPGTYTIRIRGAFPRIFFNDGGDKLKLVNIKAWGEVAWKSMERAFSGCQNLNVTATDLPNLSGVTSMADMFFACGKLNGPTNIGNWNTANVTNMSRMFGNAHAFNQSIGNWNTAKVSNMFGMFALADSFNKPIGNWNTSSVNNMGSMFKEAKLFNQPIGNWNTSNVTDMSSMFYYTDSFNQPIGNWNTVNVTIMYNMFHLAASFNRPIGSWNTASVTDMSLMFYDASAFNQPIGNWNTGNVTTMVSMFAGANAFNRPIGNWNTAKVTDMSSMFNHATSFNQPIGNWNTSNVTKMVGMFVEASSFNQPINNWNTANVTQMGLMFVNASSFNQQINNWNTAKVFVMDLMFSGAKAFNQSLGKWTLNPGVSMNAMLNNSGMDCTQYSATLIGWNDNPATPKNRTLGALGRKWGTNAQPAHLQLDILKGWTFVGDEASGVDCSPVTGISHSLSGESRENEVLLAWQTPSETDKVSFDIERSADGKTYEKIGFVDGSENVKGSNAYRFTDSSPLSVSYYRLKQFDRAAGTPERDRLNGDFEYSEVISVKKPEERIVIYPNPTSNSFYVKGLDKDQQLVIKNAEGMEVLTQLWSPGKPTNVNRLPEGTYYISVAGQKVRLIVEKQKP